MAKEFVYTKVQDLGKIGDKTVEIGHYIVDGKVMPDKVYMVNHFTRKNGSEDSKASLPFFLFSSFVYIVEISLPLLILIPLKISVLQAHISRLLLPILHVCPNSTSCLNIL